MVAEIAIRLFQQSAKGRMSPRPRSLKFRRFSIEVCHRRRVPTYLATFRRPGELNMKRQPACIGLSQPTPRIDYSCCGSLKRRINRNRFSNTNRIQFMMRQREPALARNAPVPPGAAVDPGAAPS
jgi:hypothetical protein